MTELQKKKVQIRIAKNGEYTLTAGEGFTGESCTLQTRNLELILGGSEIGSGKTDAYYDGDSDTPVSIEGLSS